MTDSPFFEDGSRLLTPPAFQFVLESDVKRAVRSQTFLTLVVLEAKREWDDLSVTADDGTIRELAQVVGREVRETDPLAQTDTGTLSLALIGTDFELARQVIDRVVARLDNYEFPMPLRLAVAAACYPTHAVDAESLRREAASRPVLNRRWRSASAEHAREK
jgi:PleD family two-component response regulator